MIGALLVIAATFFRELSSASGKDKVQHHEESIYTMAFLTFIWATVGFLLIAIFKEGSFVFVSASLPTLITRIVFELALTHTAIIAIVRADRSTFSFLHIITLPFLLLVDVALGYRVTELQIAGIVVIVLVLGILFVSHGVRRKGAALVAAVSLGAVVTISLYKYNITHFNSVVAEGLLAHLALLIYFIGLGLYKTHKNPFLALKKPVFLFQSVSAGIGALFVSFAYLFAPASAITGIKRAASILWGIISGKHIFHEKHFFIKMVAFGVLTSGIILLAV